MADLIIRIGGGDAALLTRLVTPGPAGIAPSRPDRIVVDAHVAAAYPGIAITARQAGLPMLIDPQTYYLQDHQYLTDPWAQLPFGDASVVTVADLLSPARADRLVAEALEFQLLHGATALMAPYVHIERAGDGWAEVQAVLHGATRRYVDAQHLRLPLIAPIALSWRLIGRTMWPMALDRLVVGLQSLGPDEVALVASKIDQGVQPDQRLAGLYAAIGRLRQSWPVLAWQQGLLGEACVAAGACGYETGIGWNERCDLRSKMAGRRTPPRPDAGFGARPVYIPALGRSIPKTTVAALLSEPSISSRLICLDLQCCPGGRRALIGDVRAHAVTSRAARLAALTGAHHPRWKWQFLSTHAVDGLVLAGRINTLADHPAARGAGLTKVNTGALRAIGLTADVRRRTATRRRAA